MFSSKTLNEYEWSRFHKKLDRSIGEMSFDYLRGLAIRRKRISTG